MIGVLSRAALTLSVASAAVLVGCGSGAATGSPAGASHRKVSVTSSDETPNSAPSPADIASRSAAAAYLGMWNDFVAAAATSDWRSTKLGQYATGLALSTLSRGLYADHASGLVSRGNPTHDARVSSVDSATDPTAVMITDCSDSTHALKYNARTGQPANDGPGGRRLIIAMVREQPDGSWKVVDFGVHEVGTC